MLSQFGTMLALQGFIDVFRDPATAWIIVPILIFSIPILSVVMAPFNDRVKSAERERLHKMYERLAMEKLDVIKTAVAMGYKQNDLEELDSRLESVIGSESMKALLDGKSASSKPAAKVQININKGAESSNKPLDIEDLVAAEFGEGLLQSKRERNRERED